MTNSMIPNSFIPGTKAKASEVNENFIALANAILQNRNLAASDISDLSDTLNETIEGLNSQKADKSELITEHTVTEAGTDLNNYTTKGAYVFLDNYRPYNRPKDTAGVLIVTGPADSIIKQIWFCYEDNSEIFTRNFYNNNWSAWRSVTGIVNLNNPGYIRLPNNLLIQWGAYYGAGVTYPIAFQYFAAPLFSKFGYGAAHTRSDTGITTQNLTGFSISSQGVFNHLQWIAIGV